MSFTQNASDLCRRDEPLPWLGGLRASEFLRDYWQKKPLFMPGTASGLDEPDADTLAGLALEENVEARIIRGAEIGRASCRERV